MLTLATMPLGLMASMRASPILTSSPVRSATSVKLQLGSGLWERGYTDEGHEYYYNTQTGESSWTQPADMMWPAQSQGYGQAQQGYGQAQQGDSQQQGYGQQQQGLSQLPSPWQQQADQQGNVYYYNPQTGVSQWDPPHQGGYTGHGEPAGVVLPTSGAETMGQSRQTAAQAPQMAASRQMPAAAQDVARALESGLSPYEEYMRERAAKGQ